MARTRAASPAPLAPVSASQRRVLLVNGLANVGGALVPIPILLALIPYALSRIGTNGYGVWALVSTMAAAAQLADFGIAAVVTRHIAYHHSAGERETVAEVVHSATALYLAIGASLMLAAMAAWGPIARVFFHDSGIPLDEIRFVFLASMAVFSATFAISGYASLLEGLQRLVLANALRSVGAVASGVATFALLAAGFGLRAMVAGPAAALLVRVLGLLVVVPRLYGETVRGPLRLRRSRMAEITGFSSQLSVVQLSGFGHYQLPKLFLGLFAPMAAVGAYEIAASQMQRIQNLVTGLIYPFLPALAATSRGGEEAVATAAGLYRLAHRLLALLLVPFVVGVLVFSHRFIALWLGDRYEMLGTVFVLAGIGTAALMLTAPAHYLLIGYQRMRIDMERATLGLVLTLAGVVVGAKVAGVVGATLATAVAATAAVTWLHIRARTLPPIRMSGRLVRNDYARVAGAAVPAGIAATLTLYWLPATWLGFAGALLAFLGVFGAVGLQTGVLRPAELRDLMSRRATGGVPPVEAVVPS